MRSKSISLLLYVASLLISIVAIVLIFLVKSNDKTGYINIQQVYDAFDMKKELEAEYLNIESKRKAIIDSMKIASNLYYEHNIKDKVASENEKQEIFQKQRQIEIKAKQIEEDNAALSMSYSEQILKQINQYVHDYGKEYNYKYIFGANSTGTLMYANSTENLSEKIIEYINKRYSGD